ncbi:sodium-coupled monocarboxylate transporter 2-like [Haematobia irritans]|uniref:sodium-coupled monocarboxylate transporter 2-like n=1 Tax=Haematobia irritans TaxID=7368 RepID=UPI003F509FC7
MELEKWLHTSLSCNEKQNRTKTMASSALSMASSTAASTIAENAAKHFTFGTIDYIVFVCMLLTSAGIGVYFGFFSKSKNTTDEYLMGSKKMKTIPIAISLIASQLSGISIMSVPAESYSFGFAYIYMVISVIFIIPILNYIIIPVLYKNNISNCYEYLQKRFDKRTRKFVTASFVLNACLMLPVYIFIPALAFSQVTGINIHLINTIVCSICMFYTMLGGIKAVVWTDVVQAGIMISSVVLVGVLGTLKVGGLSQVFENAAEGGRLDMYYGLDPRVRSTVIGLFSGGVAMWTGHIGLHQSCVQRIVSLPTMENARSALVIVCIGVLIIMGFNSFTGIVMFARYAGCDPILAGIVEKADKMMPFFVQDVVGHLKGMPGVFISCVFSAALSTMSANLNSLAGVVYFDYIKPFIRHTDARANAIMKVFVVVMGTYCIVGGLIVQKFNSILQTIITITSINTGAVVGVFLLGMLVPRVNGKVAFTSLGISIITMIWLIGHAQMLFKSGAIRYSPLPTTLERCEDYNFYTLIENRNTSISTMMTSQIDAPLVTTAVGSNRPFSIFEISFYWYKIIGSIIIWVTAIPLSYIWKPKEDDKYDPKLYSPFISRIFNFGPKEMESFPLQRENGNTKVEMEEKS